MGAMIFGEPPAFDEIMETLGALRGFIGQIRLIHAKGEIKLAGRRLYIAHLSAHLTSKNAKC
jgi:hypothetical protein